MSAVPIVPALMYLSREGSSPSFGLGTIQVTIFTITGMNHTSTQVLITLKRVCRVATL